MLETASTRIASALGKYNCLMKPIFVSWYLYIALYTLNVVGPGCNYWSTIYHNH